MTGFRRLALTTAGTFENNNAEFFSRRDGPDDSQKVLTFLETSGTRCNSRNNRTTTRHEPAFFQLSDDGLVISTVLESEPSKSHSAKIDTSTGPFLGLQPNLDLSWKKSPENLPKSPIGFFGINSPHSNGTIVSSVHTKAPQYFDHNPPCHAREQKTVYLLNVQTRPHYSIITTFLSNKLEK